MSAAKAEPPALRAMSEMLPRNCFFIKTPLENDDDIVRPGAEVGCVFRATLQFCFSSCGQDHPAPESDSALIAQPHLSQFFRNAAFAASKVSVVPLVGSPERGSAYSVIDQN